MNFKENLSHTTLARLSINSYLGTIYQRLEALKSSQCFSNGIVAQHSINIGRELIKEWVFEVPELIHTDVVDFFFRSVLVLFGKANSK
jgi:hypothetical protein